MTKSVYEFWLSWQNNKERIRLPVLPGKLEFSNTARNISIDIANLGEVTNIQDRTADIIRFSSFFPAHYSPLCEYPDPPPPWELVETLKRWKNSKRPIRFIVTGTPINYAVSIDEFTWSEGDKDIGDIDFSLTLKEYIFTSHRRIEIKDKQVRTRSERPNTVEKVRSYKVKQGDTLWAIAGRADIYGNHNDWRKLWNANKDMLVKRDSRNLKDPGRYIFAGQVLKVP